MPAHFNVRTPAPTGPCVARWIRLLALALGIAGVAGCASLPANIARTPSQALAAGDASALGRLVQSRRVQAGTRAGSGFRLLDSVELAFASRVALIENAQRSLDLQYYAIHADASTEVLLQRLRDAARRGVRVRLLLDDLNTVGADAQVLRLAAEPNVQIRLFNPLTGSRGSLVGRILGSLHDADRIQKRMHNKLFIADNAMGITGGRNLGDAYFGGTPDSAFIDLDVLAAGAIVHEMSASFDRYWNDELAYPVDALIQPGELQALLDKAPRLSPTPQAQGTMPQPVPPPPVPAGAATQVMPQVTASAVVEADQGAMDLMRVALTWAPAALLVDQPGKIGPGDDEVDAGDTVIDGLLALMGQARQEVLIVSPYFIPGPRMTKVFAQLRDNGVRVRVLTNSLASNDAPAAHAGYARHRHALLALGVELYEMRATRAGNGLGSGLGSGVRLAPRRATGGSHNASSRSSLHSKAVMIDRKLAVIGSMNLDLRSQLQNSEVALVVRSATLAAQASRLIEGTLARNAYRLELQGSQLAWRAPAGAAFPDAHSEPGAGNGLKLLVWVIGPFAPDEML